MPDTKKHSHENVSASLIYRKFSVTKKILLCLQNSKLFTMNYLQSKHICDKISSVNVKQDKGRCN